jgi:hypothetical protein
VDAVLIAIAVAIIVIVGLIWMVLRGRSVSPRLNPLAEESRRGYADEWRVIETRFIDHPAEAVREADGLAIRILQERGARLDSERHVPGSLRHARRLGRGRGSESLRQAMQRYQAIVDDACGRDVREAAERGRLELA